MIKRNIIVILFFVIGLILSGVSVFAATIIYDSNEVGFNNNISNLSLNNVTVDNVQDAIDSIYTKIDNQLNTCNANLAACKEKAPDTDLKRGDYFSLTPTLSTFTIKSSETGYNSDQTINPSELTLWRVIDIHSDGSVDAVSEYVSSSTVYFQGAIGFSNYVGALQTLASSYAKEGYTIGTRMIGFSGQTMTIQDESVFDGTNNTAPSTTSTPNSSQNPGQEYGEGLLGDRLYLNDDSLISSTYKAGMKNFKAYKVNDTSTAAEYWLVSRDYSYLGTDYFYFNVRYLDTSGYLKTVSLRYYGESWYDRSYNYGLRPIIVLRPGITLSGGNGTKSNPYTIS